MHDASVILLRASSRRRDNCFPTTPREQHPVSSNCANTLPSAHQRCPVYTTCFIWRFNVQRRTKSIFVQAKPSKGGRWCGVRDNFPCAPLDVVKVSSPAELPSKSQRENHCSPAKASTAPPAPSALFPRNIQSSNRTASDSPPAAYAATAPPVTAELD